MGEFFMEGGWGMYPVLVLGGILVVSAARYAMDGEPVRLRFVVALCLSLVASIATACTADVAKVFFYLESPDRVPDALFLRILAEGLKESSRPAMLGLPLLGLALIAVSIGLYRTGRRELAAAGG
jgi:hypothetical protein